MKLSFVSIQGNTIVPYRNSLFKDILPENNMPSLRLVPQLLSNNGSDFKRFATEITSLGYNEINWYIGCPVAMVTTKKKGSGILSYPDMINSFLDKACSDSTYKISVKMRLGFEYPDEGE